MIKLIRKILNLFKDQPVIGNCKHCNHIKTAHRQHKYFDPDFGRGEFINELSCKGKGTGYFGRDFCHCSNFQPIDNLIFLEKKYANING